MNLHSLKPAKGSVKKVKRIGRGQGSGHGGTSTRGMNGAGSRSGTKVKRGFEGGQMPLQRRVPKFGFKNINRVEYHVINLDRLQAISDKLKTTAIDFDTLYENNFCMKGDMIKILGRGEITKALTVEVDEVSDSARAKIEKAGGKVVLPKAEAA